jgi:hypothetical protein
MGYLAAALVPRVCGRSQFFGFSIWVGYAASGLSPDLVHRAVRWGKISGVGPAAWLLCRDPGADHRGDLFVGAIPQEGPNVPLIP